MARLGYERYGAAGSDWGTSVAAALGAQDPEHVAGIHLVPPLAAPDPATLDDPATPSARRSRTASGPRGGLGLLDASTRPGRRRSATASSTRRSRCARGSWRSCGRGRTTTATEDALDARRPARRRDALLAARDRRLVGAAVLGEHRQRRATVHAASADVIDVPDGLLDLPARDPRPSRRWAERRFTDIRYWNELSRGGHFAAFEQPALFVDELRAFARLVR